MKDIFVARQPIFDAQHRVVAYELLYRGDGQATAAGNLTDETMSSAVLVHGVIDMGLARLTEGHTAFINLSGQMLMDGVAELLDPTAVVIEILETVEPTPELVARCRTLVEKGYKLALDDFVFKETHRPLLELAEYIKVDVTTPGTDPAILIEQVKPYGAKLLAEKVESNEVHQRCVKQGFSYFQGYHYFRPETVSKREVGSQQVAIVRLMNILQDEAATERSIEETFRSDPTLTYKLLRIVNSAAMGGRGIQSIPHALRLLGREPLYRWLCLLLLASGSGGGDVRIEIIKAALLRGRMCELLSDLLRGQIRRDIPPSGAMFLIGLFARIEELIGTPVTQILDEISVATEVKQALLERTGDAGAILNTAESYADDAEWELAETHFKAAGGNPKVLTDAYLDALTWAGSKLAGADDEEAAA